MLPLSKRAANQLHSDAWAEAQKRIQKQEKERHKDVTRIPLSAFPDPVEWIQNEFYIPETSSPMELYPSQIEPLREALAMDGENFRYSLVLWSAIKKSAKSTIAAAVGLWMAFNRPYANIRVIGSDLRQSQSRVYFYMTRAIELNPQWKTRCKINRSVIYLDNQSKIEAVACDPSGEAGGGDDIVILTELWGWKSEASKKLWAETTLSPLLYGKSLRWAETYAGHVGQSELLENVWQSAVKDGECINPQYEMYHNTAGRQFSLWMTKPSLPWQTPAYYAQEAANLTENEFNRLHRNQWVSSEDKFVPDEWWEACKGDVPPLEENEPCILVSDAGVSNDSFGVLMLSGGHDGETCTVRYSRAFIPPKGGKINFADPEGEIRRLINENNVVEWVYDAFQLEDMASRFKNEMLCHCYAFSQQKDRLIADKGLHDAIQARRILHAGESDLKEHIQNANAKTEGEDKMRIVKRNESGKVDLAVCLSMGRARVKYWRL